MNQPRIGVLGLGIMGRGIAMNYLEHGYDVTVWNRSQDKTVELSDRGAKVAETPRELTENSDFVIDVTASDESSRAIFTGDEGVLARATPEQILITCATLTIAWTEELARLCHEKDLSFFDMPMTGSRIGAESGQLTLLVGGNKTRFDEIEEHLVPISSIRTYFGPPGSGMKFKLILNAIQAAHVVAFGDALRQAKAAGIDINETADFIAEKPGGYASAMARTMMGNPSGITNFAVKWILKDLLYTKEMLETTNYAPGVQVTVLDAAIARLQKAYDDGNGDKDWTVVNKL